MNRLIINIILIFIATSGTFVATKFQERKIKHTYQRRIDKLKADSTLTLKNIAILTENLTLKSNSDSIKGEFIGQLQKTLLSVSKENRALKSDTTAKSAEIQDLKSYILAAADGIVTDSVTVTKRFLRKTKITRIRK
jgi:hypothetical protein